MAKKTSAKKNNATFSVSPITGNSKANTTPARRSGGGAGFAPGSRPDVITQSGRNVFKNGKLVGTYADADKAAAAATEFNTNKQNIAGDTGGETFRTLNRTNKGTQTGKTNLAAISENMAARGFLPTVAPGTRANPSPKITGALKADQYMEKYGGRTSTDPMTRIKAEQAAIGPSKALEDKALEDALKSGAEGGANNSMPMGTDIPGKLDTEPGFRQLLQEQVYSRAYGKPYDPYPDQARTDVATAEDTTVAEDSGLETDTTTGDLSITGDLTGDNYLQDLATRFGIDLSVLTPEQATDAEVSTADTSAIDTEIDSLADSQYDTDAIEEAYDAEIASIEADKAQERKAAEDAAQSRYMERMAELAALGGNPSSSAGASLENERQMLLDKFLSQIDSEEATAKATAAATRSAGLSAANTARMTYLENKRKNAVDSEQTLYDRKRQSVSDAISNMNSVMDMMETGQRLTNTERDNTVSSLKTLLDNFGATALDGMNPTDLRKFEKALGVSSGTLRSAIAAMKSAAAKEGEKPELRDVNGSLYQLVYNATTGTWMPTLLIAKAKTSSGGGSGSSGGGGSTSVGGIEMTDALKKAAIAAYGEAYGDSASAWVNLSGEDQEALISNYIYLGGTEDRSYNPFAQSRSNAEETYGSNSQSVLQDFIDEGMATEEEPVSTETYGPTAPTSTSAWASYGIDDPFAGVSW